jgi:cytochrome c biogenesis protein CcmG, thiol:disulfide interchange protein DsbE
MNRQWLAVLAIVAGLGLGGGFWALAGRGADVVEVGRRAPDFRAVDLRTTDTVTLRDRYRGQVVLVNLWATWCTPCRKEMPAMEELYRELGPKGFQIAAVSVDEGNLKDVMAFADELGLTFDILHDGDGSVQRAYQTIMFPESFLIDREGMIVKKVIGEHPWSSDANRRIVAALLGVELEPRPQPAGASPGG